MDGAGRGYSILEPIGQRIRAVLARFRLDGITVERERGADGFDGYRMSGQWVCVQVSVHSERWLGLTVSVSGATGEALAFGIDTDNYPLGDVDQRWFAVEVEDEIVEVLRPFGGELYVGEVRAMAALIVVDGDEVVRYQAAKGFAPDGMPFGSLAEAKADGAWRRDSLR